MHVLHVTAHLGGGVGKAHAALRAVMPENVHQTYLLLEEPRDRRYADEIVSNGGELVVARNLDDVARHCAGADIVQFEFWNHPKLFECLARTAFPAMRSVFWAHVSGLFRPVIAPGFLAAADRFVFTTPASMPLGEGLTAERRAGLSSIGSGFGFAASPTLKFLDLDPPITYLGTVDFIKMHPGFFDAIDILAHDTEVAIWGAYDIDGAVAAKARSMHHPDRIRFKRQTADPQSALSRSRIFFYPLQPDHYGTAENALIEAMSLGLVPVVLDNPAECAIVEHGVTGFVATSIDECVAILDRLLISPVEIERIGRNAAGVALERYTPGHSAGAFVSLWSSVLAHPKHGHDFASVTGRTPLDWYCATQFLPGEGIRFDTMTGKQSKGTLAHFRSAFPDDPCWDCVGSH